MPDVCSKHASIPGYSVNEIVVVILVKLFQICCSIHVELRKTFTNSL